MCVVVAVAVHFHHFILSVLLDLLARPHEQQLLLQSLHPGRLSALPHRYVAVSDTHTRSASVSTDTVSDIVAMLHRDVKAKLDPAGALFCRTAGPT